jgi:transcriptional regulator with XRE-family HTH domain
MPELPEPLIGKVSQPVKKNEKSVLPTWLEMGKRLRIARGKRPASEIEELSGVSATAIGKCEKGQQILRLDLLAYYERKENIPISLILFGAKSTGEDPLTAIRIQCQSLTESQRHLLGLELISGLQIPDAP